MGKRAGGRFGKHQARALPPLYATKVFTPFVVVPFPCGDVITQRSA